MTPLPYVHGYSPRENAGLSDQARTLAELLHHGVTYSAKARVPEADCGAGAQTVILARNSPEAQFLSVDRSAESLASGGWGRSPKRCKPIAPSPSLGRSADGAGRHYRTPDGRPVPLVRLQRRHCPRLP